MRNLLHFSDGSVDWPKTPSISARTLFRSFGIRQESSECVGQRHSDSTIISSGCFRDFAGTRQAAFVS